MFTAQLKNAALATLTTYAFIMTLSIGTATAATTLLSENFEDNVLDSRMSVSTIGSFSIQPGIQANINFGSTRAFGYGASTCSASCFNSFVTRLLIDFGTPTLVSTIEFKEMELFDNWGSNGVISVDVSSLTGQATDFGRLPYNDRVADLTFRKHTFAVNKLVSVINIGVYDITNRSQIVLDDLVVTTVPEIPTAAMFALGLGALLASTRRKL